MIIRLLERVENAMERMDGLCAVHDVHSRSKFLMDREER